MSALQLGHEVAIYTTHHDSRHCFAETTGDGMLAPLVHAHGDWLPRQLLGRCTAACATVRMAFLAIHVAIRERRRAHVFICDGVSAPVPVLRLTNLPVLFYCHFPDKLLCVERSNIVKRLYRLPLDLCEEVFTGMSSTIAVNSRYTAGIFAQAFPLLRRLGWRPRVLYPPIDLNGFAARPAEARPRLGPIVSINRFERKKNVVLAVDALAIVRGRCSAELFSTVQLVIAGGYDPRVRENIQYKEELMARVAELSLGDNVQFRPNLSNAERSQLLREASCVLYTPDREHFGIVPLEAMYAGAPVVAVASGGPLETVLDGETGFLCQQTPEDFACAVLKFVRDPSLTLSMGAHGRAHVSKKFSLEAFGAAFQALLLETVDLHAVSSSRYIAPLVIAAALLALAFAVVPAVLSRLLR
ncbi:alpha--mannosyltransferase, family GT4 [Tribonema minus]|uniref:Alpha-1,3/1,6-mannosyltransferase ALG2 n=1 Tax=Tribonema minus TaxID=303371 RepID=A0A835YXC3_9STRA|nr:alpha--mannosyltransferase, family GT4 [Tribonema minus]